MMCDGDCFVIVINRHIKSKLPIFFSCSLLIWRVILLLSQKCAANFSEKRGMGMKEQTDLSALAAWRLFEKTGSPTAYVCYCNIRQKP